MSPSLRRHIAGFGPWIALVAGPSAWLALQQGSGAMVYFGCARYGAAPAVTAGGLALAVCVLGAAWSWRSARGAAPARRFMARVGVGVAAVSAFGVVLVTLAVLIGAPPCAR